MTLKEQVLAAARAGAVDDLEALAAADARVVRLLLGLSYDASSELRAAAAKGIARAARHRPNLVQQAMRRLIWAMNDESGTNAVTAPAVLRAVALERPDILRPLLPDLRRLSDEPELREDLSAAVRLVEHA